MIEDIKDWVEDSNTSFTLIYCSEYVLQFHDGLHRYKVQDDSFDVALHEDFDRWANSRLYYMERPPYSKEDLMRVVSVCHWLTTNIGRELLMDGTIGYLNVERLVDIFQQ